MNPTTKNEEGNSVWKEALAKTALSSGLDLRFLEMTLQLKTLPRDRPVKDEGKTDKLIEAQLAESFSQAKEKLGLRKDASTRDIAEAIGARISTLGDEEWEVREKSTRTLESLGPAAVKEVAKALETSNDLEVRRRSRRILEKILDEGFSTLYDYQQKIVELKERTLSTDVTSTTDEMRAQQKILKHPTPEITDTQLLRVKSIQKQLQSAGKEIADERTKSLPKETRDDQHKVQNVPRIGRLMKVAEDIPERVHEVRSSTATARLTYAEKLAASEPQKALSQLKMAWKDDREYCNLTMGFYKPAAIALEKQSDKQWLGWARKEGVDMSHLATVQKLVRWSNQSIEQNATKPTANPK